VEDGALFVLTISLLGLVPVVSLVCVRSAAYVWPLYIVKMWAHGPPTSHRKKNNMEVEDQVSSSASPGSITSEELTSFLIVPPPYLVGAGLSRHMRFYICIDKNSTISIL
jgi:hypothetical protein